MWKFKSWKTLKGRDKWLFLLTVGLMFCIMAFPADKLAHKVMPGEEVSGTRQQSMQDTAGLWETSGSADSQEENQSMSAAAAYPSSAKIGGSYEEELEHRVREILKTVDGVGAVDVMIVLKSSSEKVIHVDGSSSYSRTEEQDSSGGTRKVENQEQEENTVMSSYNGENSPVIEKELCPELSGIIISAEGGGNPVVRSEISAAMEALFGLPAHKIKVLKRVE